MRSEAACCHGRNSIFSIIVTNCAETLTTFLDRGYAKALTLCWTGLWIRRTLAARRHGEEAMMDKFIQRLNIEHYQRLLKTITDAGERERIQKLLAEEMDKNANNGEKNPPPRRAG